MSLGNLQKKKKKHLSIDWSHFANVNLETRDIICKEPRKLCDNIADVFHMLWAVRLSLLTLFIANNNHVIFHRNQVDFVLFKTKCVLFLKNYLRV